MDEFVEALKTISETSSKSDQLLLQLVDKVITKLLDLEQRVEALEEVNKLREEPYKMPHANP